jgi:hypothetical protein
MVDPMSIASALGLPIFRSRWSPVVTLPMIYPPFRPEGVGRATSSFS